MNTIAIPEKQPDPLVHILQADMSDFVCNIRFHQACIQLFQFLSIYSNSCIKHFQHQESVFLEYGNADDTRGMHGFQTMINGIFHDWLQNQFDNPAVQQRFIYVPFYAELSFIWELLQLQISTDIIDFHLKGDCCFRILQRITKHGCKLGDHD